MSVYCYLERNPLDHIHIWIYQTHHGTKENGGRPRYIGTNFKYVMVGDATYMSSKNFHYHLTQHVGH